MNAINSKLFLKDLQTGEIHEFDGAKDIIETPYNDEAEEYARVWNMTKSFECTMKTSRSQINAVMVAVGLKKCVSNNWLKMHHYPMNRRMRNDHSKVS